MHYVQTVWFTDPVQVGRQRMSLSMENTKEAKLYEITAHPELQIVQIRLRTQPTMGPIWVPFARVKWMTIRSKKPGVAAKPKSTTAKPPPTKMLKRKR